MANNSTPSCTKFILQSLRCRTPVDIFESQIHAQIEKIPTNEAAATQLLQPATSISHPDPLHLSYIQCLVEKSIIPLPDVLRALLQFERNHVDPNASAFVETALFILVRAVQSAPPRRENIWPTISAFGEWMNYFVETKEADIIMAPGSSRKQKLDAVYEFLIVFGEIEEVSRIYHSGNIKDRQAAFSASILPFTTYLLEIYPHSDVKAQLQRYYGSRQTDSVKPNGNELGIGDDLLVGEAAGDHDTIDNMVLLARGAIYAWVNSMLIGRPLVDDDLIMGYLTHRYKNETQQLVTEFVTAVFDNILSAVHRSESPTQMFILRCFLVNKVPLIISSVSVLLPPLAINDCLSTALSKGDSSALSSIAASAADPLAREGQGGADMFQLPVDVRQEFLFACSLHHVLEESAIQGILGDLPSQPGATANYSADSLFAQFESDPEKIEGYLDEIGMMDGNACAIVRAVAKTIGMLCQQRRTDVLKNICGSLARRPPFLDVVIMFTKPHEILEPLCNLLDTWQFDNDQGECFSFYEEFGFVLLLVLSIIYRYDLQTHELGNVSPESFVPKLIKAAMNARGSEPATSKEQNELAGKWISGMFADDGITDELLGSCRPQDFYMLVPSICSQGVLAATVGVLDVQVLKNGFKHFLVPFLLPSLLGVLNWLSHYLWETRTTLEIPMDILHSLVSPASISEEARQIHQTVIALASPNIERTLRELLRANPVLHNAERILNNIPNLKSSRRTATAYQRELESWVSMNSGGGTGGLLQSLRNAINSLVAWSTAQDMNSNPPVYSHKLLLTCVKLLGAQEVIRTMAAELVRLQAQAPLSGDIALDIISSLICAPTTDDFYARTTQNEIQLDQSQSGLPQPSALSPLVQALYAEEEQISSKIKKKDEMKSALKLIKKRVQLLLTPYTHTAFPAIPNLGLDDMAGGIGNMTGEMGAMGGMAGGMGSMTGDQAALMGQLSGAGMMGMDMGMGMGADDDMMMGEDLQTGSLDDLMDF